MSKKATESDLTIKQLLFCHEYLVDMNGTNACIRAGYAESGAAVESTRLLRNAKVRQKVSELIQGRSKRVQLTGDQVLKRLDHFSVSDPASCYNEHGVFKNLHDIPKEVRLAIKQIKTFEQFGPEGEKIGEIKEITFVDRVKATELLGKNLKLFNEEKTIKHTHTLESLVTGAGQRDVTPPQLPAVNETEEGDDEV